jgi:hypothetical protein
MATTSGDDSGRTLPDSPSAPASGTSEATRTGGDLLGMIAGAALLLTALLAVVGTIGYMVVSSK